ncbi:MAG TPA: AAA family ATPase, partial [Capillimicrobium sp.]
MSELLERERELEAVALALRRAQGGQGAFVLVEAPAGMGKTSLLREALARGRAEGFACLRARASELEHGFAYGCVRQLLDPAVARDPDPGRLFAGAAALARPLFGAADDGRGGDPFARLHGLYWLLSAMTADRPLLLAVDDLHWADAASVRFLAYLSPRLDGLPVSVVATARPGEGDGGLLARVASAPEVEVVRPAALSPAATLALCRRALPGAAEATLADACHEATAGNPFFLEALLGEIRDRQVPPAPDTIRRIGPASVARSVLLRLSGAPLEATRLVRAVAVLGDGATLEEAAALSGLAPGDVAPAADVLAALGILGVGATLEFTHPIVRQAVSADLGPAERGALHARAAALLLADGAAAERVAAQVQHAPPAADPERIAPLRQAAREALARGAPDAAVAWLARALAEPPPEAARAELLFELGCAELRLGSADAVEHLGAAAERL